MNTIIYILLYSASNEASIRPNEFYDLKRKRGTTNWQTPLYAEAGFDFSGSICLGATIGDLDTNAIDEFRKKWAEKFKSPLHCWFGFGSSAHRESLEFLLNFCWQALIIRYHAAVSGIRKKIAQPL